jgi:hypothetical protein
MPNSIIPNSIIGRKIDFPEFFRNGTGCYCLFCEDKRVSRKHFKAKPPDYTCASSPFIYNPTGHVVTGNLKIINNTSLRDVFAKGSKYREPKSINSKHNFKILMNSVENYAKQ